MLKLKEKRGITLVALVITIIILLILAGITISQLNDNGLFEKVKLAKEKNDEAKELEDSILSEYENQIGRYTGNQNSEDPDETDTEVPQIINIAKGTNAATSLVITYTDNDSGVNGYYCSTINSAPIVSTEGWTSIETTTSGTATITGLTGNTTYYVWVKDAEGNVSSVSSETTDYPSVSASQVKASPTIYYGKHVNYSANDIEYDSTAENSDLTGWKILYSNGSNIFIITADYIPYNKVPTSSTGMTNTDTENKPYNAWWSSSAVPDYQSGWATEKISFMHTKYTLQTNKSNYPNSACVSTLLNCTNWSGFVDINKADKAIGSPTLEMWVASWNDIYTSDTLYTNTGTNGYCIGTDNASTTSGYVSGSVMSAMTGYSNSLYYPHPSSWDGCNGYCLASPSAYWNDTYRVMHVGWNGNLSYAGYDNEGYSVRPVVRLTSDIQIID